jgi:triacylglycerol lipase
MVSGVNHGSKIIDAGLGYVPMVAQELLAAAINIFGKIFYYGDDSNDVITALKWMSHKYMTETFNPNTPDKDGVYYQSWAGKMKFIVGDPFLQPTWAYIKLVEGDNDGCVPVESAKWGKFRGVISGAWWSGGVSHFNAVGHFFGVTPGFSAPNFYVDMVEELQKMGF